MVELPHGEKSLRICLLISIQCTNVTDGQTDGWMDTAQRHSVARQKVTVERSVKKSEKSVKVVWWATCIYDSAVAEKPRDALCPSVVSLNKITRAESFIIVT